MSLIRRKSGKFIVIDAANLSPTAFEELNRITDNGKKIEAVVHTHPFHTSYVRSFAQKYPDAALYGCPRHLELFKVRGSDVWYNDYALLRYLLVRKKN
jgi:hypothetical protein